MDLIVEITFWTSSVLIFPLWAMMWFFPRHEVTEKIVGDLRYSIIPLIIPYAILLIPNITKVLFSLGTQMPTPDVVVELFSEDVMIILAWLHFLAMDTFAGRFVWKRMLAANKPIKVSLPILVTCMMVAPIGLMIGILTTLDVKDNYSIIDKQ